MILIFDTETTGLPERKGRFNYYSYKRLDKYNSSRLVSICWKKFTPSGKCIKTVYHIIKPKDFEIDDTSIATEINGITQEIANNDGVDINTILNDLNPDNLCLFDFNQDEVINVTDIVSLVNFVLGN